MVMCTSDAPMYESNGLVDMAHGTDMFRIFARSIVHYGVHENLNRVLVCEKVDDFEQVGDDAESKLFLSVVAALHHQRVDDALDNGHLGFAELVLRITPGGVREVDWAADLNIVDERDVFHLDTICDVSSLIRHPQKCEYALVDLPVTEQFYVCAERRNFL